MRYIIFIHNACDIYLYNDPLTFVTDSSVVTCSAPVMRLVADSESGVAVVKVPSVDGLTKISLLPGDYYFDVTSGTETCTVNVRITGEQCCTVVSFTVSMNCYT